MNYRNASVTLACDNHPSESCHHELHGAPIVLLSLLVPAPGNHLRRADSLTSRELNFLAQMQIAFPFICS
jgi:hypothetical protein